MGAPTAFQKSTFRFIKLPPRGAGAFVMLAVIAKKVTTNKCPEVILLLGSGFVGAHIR